MDNRLLLSVRPVSASNTCRNVTKTLDVSNGSDTSTSFFSDLFIAIVCRCNNTIIFNSDNVSKSSQFQLKQKDDNFTIVISSVTTEMAYGMYGCTVLASDCYYTIKIDFKIFEVSTSILRTATLKVGPNLCQTPAPITSMSITNVTHSSLVIVWEWSSNSDCGETTFFVDCITPPHSSWNESVAIENRNSSKNHNLLIENLVPGTGYSFVFFARNPIGKSQLSFIFGSTKDDGQQPCRMSPPEQQFSTENDINFTVIEISSIAIAFLFGCIVAGCVIYSTTTVNKCKKKSNEISTNYQPHTQNPTITQAPRLVRNRPSNDYSKQSIYDTNIQQPRAAQPRAGQPRAGQPWDGQPRAGKPRAGQPRDGQPCAGQPCAGQPCAGRSQFSGNGDVCGVVDFSSSTLGETSSVDRFQHPSDGGQSSCSARKMPGFNRFQRSFSASNPSDVPSGVNCFRRSCSAGEEPSEVTGIELSDTAEMSGVTCFQRSGGEPSRVTIHHTCTGVARGPHVFTDGAISVANYKSSGVDGPDDCFQPLSEASYVTRSNAVKYSQVNLAITNQNAVYHTIE
ncbi:uncharacterized protein [Antedon mediterranea]|uniref:uncharacterized protein isoform X1 n=1 Tax=Antedon mediterranea TaxID=105859 RepID=UPI003AF62C50